MLEACRTRLRRSYSSGQEGRFQCINPTKTRREFLSRVAGLVGPLATGAAAIAKGAIANNDGDDGRLEGPADVTLRIAPVQCQSRFKTPAISPVL